MGDSLRKATVVGGGSWGTTLADLLASKGIPTSIWVREEEICASIQERRENHVFLPGVTLSENLRATTSFKEALKGTDLVVSSVPSHFIGSVFGSIIKDSLLPEGVPVVSTSKGIEEESLQTPSQILTSLIYGSSGSLESGGGEIVVLSGPSFAKEVSDRRPTAITAASSSQEAATLTQRTFSTPYFRVYTNTDIIGVELGGVLKNVMAIASGISDGLELGGNARAALITRGLAESKRLGLAMGGLSETFGGLSGLGDLVLTATGTLSRNYTLGRRIGGGESLADILDSMQMVAEGVKTSRAIRSLGTRHGVEMPITEEVCRVLYEGKPPREAVMDLMCRDLKEE